MINLYGSATACSTALHMFLEMIGEDYTYHNVGMHSPELNEFNPRGRVPAMTDSDMPGVNMTQLVSIFTYLIEKYPDNKVVGNLSLKDNYKLHQMFTYLSSDFHKAFAPAFAPMAFTTSNDEGDQKAVYDARIKNIEKELAYTNKLLEGKTYLILDTLTPADLYAHIMIRWANNMDSSIVDKYENIVKFQENIYNVPEVKKVWDYYKSNNMM